MKRPKTKGILAFALMLCILVSTGCVKRESNSNNNSSTAETTAESVKKEYNNDVVIITDINEAGSKISVESLQNTENIYTLNYSGSTSIQNKYGSEILMSRLSEGDIVEISYMAGRQKLISIKEPDTVWKNDMVTKWNINYDDCIFSIGGDNYRYSEDLYVNSGNKTISINEISSVDTLVVRGIGNQIYSITVASGHGYIKLTDYSQYLGGIVDVNGQIVTVIVDDMLIVAPEGELTLSAYKNGYGGSTTVSVDRDTEVSVSLSGFDSIIQKNGALKLNVLPAGTDFKVYIDNVKADISDTIDLSYGSHSLIITSDAYEDYVDTLVISSIYTTKVINLSQGEEAADETTAESESTEENTTSSSGQNGVITVTAPEGASLYLDGIYMGTIPLTFDKEEGSHVIILRQTGYDTVVYNVEFSEDDTSGSIKFESMEKTTTADEKSE